MGNKEVESLPVGYRVLAGLFQAFGQCLNLDQRSRIFPADFSSKLCVLAVSMLSTSRIFVRACLFYMVRTNLVHCHSW